MKDITKCKPKDCEKCPYKKERLFKASRCILLDKKLKKVKKNI